MGRMRKFAPSLLSSRHVTSVSNLLAHWFPMPRILHPRSVGVDISDASIKWIALEAFGEKKRVIFWGEELLPEGIVIGGIVQNFPELVTALEGIRKKLGGIVSVHVALPEEIGYVFSMHVPVNSSRESALHMIEFELEARVPIPVADAVYDFDLITQHDNASCRFWPKAHGVRGLETWYSHFYFYSRRWWSSDNEIAHRENTRGAFGC